jgi:hypothetical protein
MKKILSTLLLVCTALNIYGMSGQEDALDPEDILDSSLIWPLGAQPSYTTQGSNLLPLPSMPTQEERASNQIGAQETISVYIPEITSENAKIARVLHTQVKNVFVHGNNITPGCILLLAITFPHITSLDLTETNLTTAGLKTFAHANIFPALTHLNLALNMDINADGITALRNAAFAGQLEELDLEETGIGITEIQALAQSSEFTGLKKLNLSQNTEIGIDGVTALRNAPFAHQLEYLNVRNSGTTRAQIETLVTPDVFKSLKELVI